jgi:hypothetical protein
VKEIAYIETTIVSYLVVRPSRDLALSAHQQVTREWWENERVNYHCIASEEVAREAMLGDTGMAQARIKVLEEVQIVGITAEVEAMAATFMATDALPPTMRPDATHLAAATLSGADYLLTWNCRHLANAHVLRRLQMEAERRGWQLPGVCTPLELMGDCEP